MTEVLDILDSFQDAPEQRGHHNDMDIIGDTHTDFAAGYSTGNSTNMTTAPPIYDEEDYHDLQARLYQFLTHPHQIIMLALAFIAITVNVLSLVALFHIRNRMNSHYRLIISLSASDLLIGLSILFYLMNRVINPLPVNRSGVSRCIFLVIRALITTALNISLLNLMGMSIDHYLAINKPLHYPKLMNQARVRMMILILWTVAFFCGFLNLITAVFYYPQYKGRYLNYCEIAHESSFHEEYIMMAIAAICLVVMMFIYINIYRTVAQHKAPGIRHQVKSEERRNRRALITTLLILGSFVLCWIPQCLFQIIMIIRLKTSDYAFDPLTIKLAQANIYLQDLILVNSICDPIIYTVRTYEVQLGYRRMFSGCFKRPFLDRKRSAGFATTQSSLLKNPNDANLRIVDIKNQGNKYINATAL